MEHRFNPWISWFGVIFSSLIIVMSIYGIFIGKESSLFIFTIIVFMPVLLVGIMTLRQIPKDKIKDMSVKEKRLAKLKKLK